jgi:ParB family chromosome partitioning protein
MTQEEVSKKVGKERSTVTNIMRLLQLPDTIKVDVANGRISMGHARVLLGVTDEENQKKLRDAIIQNGLSVREIEKLVASHKKKQTSKAKAVHKSKQRIPEHHCRAIAEDIARIFGNKAKVVQNGTRGKIEVAYYSLEDLERIHTLLTRLQVEENGC